MELDQLMRINPTCEVTVVLNGSQHFTATVEDALSIILNFIEAGDESEVKYCRFTNHDIDDYGRVTLFKLLFMPEAAEKRETLNQPPTRGAKE